MSLSERRLRTIRYLPVALRVADHAQEPDPLAKMNPAPDLDEPARHFAAQVKVRHRLVTHLWSLSGYNRTSRFVVGERPVSVRVMNPSCSRRVRRSLHSFDEWPTVREISRQVFGPVRNAFSMRPFRRGSSSCALRFGLSTGE